MAFPSNVGSHQDDLDSAWRDARGIAGEIKTRATSLKAQSLAGPVGSSVLLGFLTFLANAKVRLNICKAVPGIAAYVQSQVNDNTLDVAAAFTSMVSALDSIRDWMITNFPASGGFLLSQSFDANGFQVDRTFSTATLATFRTQLDNLIATID